MKNILLILDNSMELDLGRTILTKLGFNLLSFNKNLDLTGKFKENFPDLVVTSVVGGSEEMLKEFIKIRQQRGVPKFIWVGPDIKLRRLGALYSRLIDISLKRPLQPEQFIRAVCDLLELSAEDFVGQYYRMLSGSMGAQEGTQSPLIHDSVRAAQYSEKVKSIEKLDKVFTAKDLVKHNSPTAGDENTEDLLNKKKEFLKSIFRKKA
ncbi:MAG: hypothetical protein H6623_02245 [Bdellovibrionaceae bacterium]|nr:hypothetical protein [Pseudobdellovibrionaceae bacterium]